MGAYLLGNRILILGFVGVLGIAAEGAQGYAPGGAPGIDPDGSRVGPDPIGGSGAPSMARKSSGELDTSFAGDGTTWSYLPGGGGPAVDPQDLAEAVAVDAGGGIVVATHGAIHAFAIVRYTADGTLDTTFGSNGLATPFAGMGGQARAMAIQPDGRIVVGGFAAGSFALARLMADGSFDASFGSGGQVLSDISPGASELAYGMALQADGRIVLAGQADGGSGVVVTLARYNTDGSLDATFGAGGLVFSGFPGGANAVAVQPDGRIVVAGFSFLVTRFNADGTLDTGFGSGGQVAVPFGDTGWESEAFAILVQPDGGVVVAGGTYGSQYEFAVARLGPAGSLDRGFGHDGMVTTDFYGGRDSARALVLQPDGRLVAAGFGRASNQSDINNSHFALARYESNGALDRSFGKSGRATGAIDNPVFNDFARALAAQPDGRLVAAGNIHIVCEVAGCDFSGYALARFLP